MYKVQFKCIADLKNKRFFNINDTVDVYDMHGFRLETGNITQIYYNNNIIKFRLNNNRLAYSYKSLFYADKEIHQQKKYKIIKGSIRKNKQIKIFNQNPYKNYKIS